MINYLTITSRSGERSLTILNTEAKDIGLQIEKARDMRNISDYLRRDPKIRVTVAKNSHAQEFGESVEPMIANAIARRQMWTLYSENGDVIGSGAGDWATWYVKSPLVDNTVLALCALRELERMRLECDPSLSGVAR